MSIFVSKLDRVLCEWDYVTPDIVRSLGVMTPSRISDEPAAEMHRPFFYIAAVPKYDIEEMILVGKPNTYHNNLIADISEDEDTKVAMDPLSFLTSGPKLTLTRILKGLYNDDKNVVRDSTGMTVSVTGAVGRIGYKIRKQSIADSLMLLPSGDRPKERQGPTATMARYEEIKAEMRSVPPISVVSYYNTGFTNDVDVERCNKLLLNRKLINPSFYVVKAGKVTPVGSEPLTESINIRCIREGHWVVAPGDYPGFIPSLKGKVKKANRHSFLLHPDDRSRFIKWSGVKGGKDKGDGIMSPVS